MLLFTLMLTVVAAGLAAAASHQAPSPHRVPVWDDATELRYLRAGRR